MKQHRPPKYRPLTGDELAGIVARMVTAVGALTEVVTDDGDTVPRVERTRRRAIIYAPGVAASPLEGRRSASGPADPVGRAVVNAERRVVDEHGVERHAGWRADPSEWWPIELAVASRASDAALGRLVGVVTAIDAHATPDDVTGPTPKRRPTLGAGLCRACDHDSPGTATDRLRGGLCDRCRKREARGDWPDRATFVRDARADAGLDPLHPDTEEDRRAS